eukprot:5556524-Pleurochrysis_carterae.AAC.3
MSLNPTEQTKNFRANEDEAATLHLQRSLHRTLKLWSQLFHRMKVNELCVEAQALSSDHPAAAPPRLRHTRGAHPRSLRL